jgi:K+-sensing histidine kinase KdpD
MQLGYLLLKEQIFIRKELKERVFWFIKLRWIAVGAALSGTWAVFFSERPISIIPLNAVLFSIIIYNIIFLMVGKKLESFRPHEVRPFTIFAHFQISLDLLALFLFIYFTGGIASPLLIFVIFHIILAGILLPPYGGFIYGIFVIIGIAILMMIQISGFLPIKPVVFVGPVFLIGREYPWLRFIYYTVAILVSGFLITSVAVSLRRKGRELLMVSRELESSNVKLKALYEMVKELGSYTELKDLMDSATRNAARIMGVKACSIKLLDEQKRSLRFTSTYGLSEDYLAKGSIDIEKSPINQKILQGSSFVIGNIDEKEYFQYPEDIQREGIASMLCLPLRVEKMIFGVFCVYSEKSYHFGNGDVEFFSLMSDLTALAIENLRSGLTKSWFMMKAAHQLRSPLTAIYSMIKILRRGYLGPLDRRQEETLERCEKRIEILEEVINDLLKLGAKRSEPKGGLVTYPVDLKNCLNRLIGIYESQASEKGLKMDIHIEEAPLIVMGNEELIDDILTNLISNAIKYTPPGGNVSVILSKKGDDFIRIEVLDTGIGIPEKEMVNLFSEFFRAENAREFDEHGTGLGLVIVKEALEKLNGTIQVESKLGEGSKFICFIPSCTNV